MNKVDRPEARPNEVVDETLELLMELEAGDKQLDCPFVFASAKEGFAVLDMEDEKKDMKPLFETVIQHIEAPEGDRDISNIFSLHRILLSLLFIQNIIFSLEIANFFILSQSTRHVKIPNLLKNFHTSFPFSDYML